MIYRLEMIFEAANDDDARKMRQAIGDAINGHAMLGDLDELTEAPKYYAFKRTVVRTTTGDIKR